MFIGLIAALTAEQVIGKDGDLPWHYSEDLKHFKTITMGKPMIMGRKTYESFGAKPLPGRQHIILSRNQAIIDKYTQDNVVVVTSVDAALKATGGNASEVMVIGGKAIYGEFLPLASRMYLTFIDKKYPGDTYFPKIDWDNWLVKAALPHTGFTIKYFERITT